MGTVDHQARMKMLLVLALAAAAAATSEAEAEPIYGYGYGHRIGYGRSYGGYGLSYGHGYGGYVRSYYGKREAEPTAVAEAEADPYYRSYGYGGHGLSYRTYTRSYPVVSYGRRYGGYGLSYGGYGGYGRSYYGNMEATADPMVDTVDTTAAMGMAILPTTTRQHLEHRHHTNNPKLLKYQLEKIKFDVFTK